MGQVANPRRVLLYELNEVPWEVLDRYADRRPTSHVARLLSASRCETTVNSDPGLQPWRTWPTFHSGLTASEHKSFDLGQDPETFEGAPIWDIAEASGLSFGLFGPLQSWPARAPRNGGFYVPDTFSRSADVYPSSMRRFQEFNLFMTREQGFSSNAPLDARRLALAGADIARRGLTPWSAVAIARQLVRERFDDRYKACRSIFQALPAFDLYWRLHRSTRPHLSIFFTNHVAGMMHRFWGDAFPEYASEHDYQPDPVFARFVDDAMDITNHQLGRVMRFVDREPESVLIVAASMGQRAIPYAHIGETYVIRDVERLAAALELGPLEEGLAMYPKTSLKFPTEDAAARACSVIAAVRAGDEPLVSDAHADRLTVSFAVRSEGVAVEEIVHGTTGDPGAARTARADSLGIQIERRLGGGNTAHHSPAGPMLTYGSSVAPDSSRAMVDVLNVAPSILHMLGVPDDQREQLDASRADASA